MRRRLTSLLCLVFAGPIYAATNLLPMARETFSEIVFCTRARYDDPHWYANIGYYCDDANQKAYAGNGKPDAGRLLALDVASGKTRTIFDAGAGSVRDPQVHYDGRTILFSHRPAGSDWFHLYEIQADGTGLKQLTDGPFDDFEPAYLPDGAIVFVSTRCKRWVNCWMTQVATLHRREPDGSITRISANTEHDNTPWVMPDGRLLYTRWEYVDRSQVEYHGLWTMNPDGTDQNVYFGNMYSWIVMIDAKPIPGTRQIVASFSPGHGHNEHNGIVNILSATYGPDAKSLPQPLNKNADVRDPYPLSDRLVLAARGASLILLSTMREEQTIYTSPDKALVHEPRPLVARPREKIIPTRANPRQENGRFFVADVYRGRNLPGVNRGDIRKLLILESLPKPVNFSGGMDLTSWSGGFTIERVLGTVPVEADGSAWFEAPAGRQLFFVALDERDLSVKRMQSWTSVMPGETMSCLGCHEQRLGGPALPHGQPLATQREPSRIEAFAGQPDVLDFNRDIQPILDRRCVSCHGPEKYDANLTLAGDLGPHWSIAYFSLLARKLVADGRNGLGNQPPRTIGSSASPLLRYGDGKHFGATYTPAEWRTLWMWIEAGAPYAGSYAGLRNKAQQEACSTAYGAVFGGAASVFQKRCATCHQVGANGKGDANKPLPHHFDGDDRKNAGRPTGQYERIVADHDPVARFSANVLLNLTRPECSALLRAPLAKKAGGWEKCGAVFADANDPDYGILLAALKRGASVAAPEPRWGMAGFKPNEQYIREMKRFGILPAGFERARDSIDVFATDQRYWQSLWLKPAAPQQTAAKD